MNADYGDIIPIFGIESIPKKDALVTTHGPMRHGSPGTLGRVPSENG